MHPCNSSTKEAVTADSWGWPGPLHDFFNSERYFSNNWEKKRKKNVVCIWVTTNKFVFWPLHKPFTVPGLSTCTDAYKYMHICIHMNSHMCTHIYHNRKKRGKENLGTNTWGKRYVASETEGDVTTAKTVWTTRSWNLPEGHVHEAPRRRNIFIISLFGLQELCCSRLWYLVTMSKGAKTQDHPWMVQQHTPY